MLAPAQAQQEETDAEMVAKGRELFLVGCSFCHGQNGEGIRTENGNQLGPPLAGVGAAAVDFQVSTGRMPMAQPGAQAPRKRPAYSEEEVAALAAYVASLGPGPAIPDESDYSTEGMTDEEREEADQPRWPDLPDQLHRLPQLRRLGWRHARGRLRTQDPRGRAALHLRGDADRSAEHAELLQHQPHPRREARRDRLPRVARRDTRVRRVRHGWHRSGQRGHVRLARRHRRVRGFAIWIAAHTTRSKKDKAEPEAAA